MTRGIRLWLSKSSEVPVREQLATQLLLAILSKDLKPGQRLPSTRELARRLLIHANTVSAAYRDLTRRGWLELRKGSGVYVRSKHPGPAPAPGLAFDRMIADLFEAARDSGFTLSEIRERLHHWLEHQPPDHFLVIEPDAPLRQILVTEIQEATGFPVRGADPDACAAGDLLIGAMPVFFFNKAADIRARIPGLTVGVCIEGRSAVSALADRFPVRAEARIVVVSAWPEFLKWARAFLAAAGVDADAMHFANPERSGWQRGLRGATTVIADARAAKRIPAGLRLHVFNLIADESIKEIRALREFLSSPIF